MKALLFDFGGTLDGDGLTWGQRFFPIYTEAGLAVSRDSFNKAFWKADDELPVKRSLSGLDLAETVALQVADTLATLAPDRADLGKVVAARFTADCRKAFDRNRPVLKELKKKYRLGIVSNFYGNLEGILEREGLAEYFEVVADSHVVGHTKPSKEIFLYATGRLNLKPEECMMIGDSLPRDMKGAEALGMPHAYLTADDTEPCCGSALRLRRIAGLLS